MFDRKTMEVGTLFLAFNVILLFILLMKPFEPDVMGLISSVGVFIAFGLALGLAYLAVKLYGRKSSEGRFWYLMVIMLTISLIGVMASSLLPIKISFEVFSLFLAIGFIIIIYGILDKIKSAGVKPEKSDLLMASVVIIFILALISILMRNSGEYVPEDFKMRDYAVEWFVMILAFTLTFLTVVMGGIMGGHISHGWYFLAAGAGIYATTYTFMTILIAFEWYYWGHYIGAFNVMALNAVAFSAWYQRKKHMELMSKI